MKILLCCTSIEDEHRSEDNHDSHYPLGLAYLQSYLEHHRPDKDEFVNLYLNNVDYEAGYNTIKKHLKEFQPEVVGFSIMTHNRVTSYRMIEHIHENYPNIKIIVGGMHVSVMWKQFVEKYPYVLAVRGEGEEVLCEIVEAYENETSLKEIGGLSFFDEETNKVFSTESRPLIADLDALPFPKHSLFVSQGKTMANLLTSRGCPYKCNFCVLDTLSRRNVRFRSGENIADEVEQLLSEFPSITTIWIHDDAFMINKNRTIEFCDAIIKRGIKTQFVASARFRPISKEVVRKMEQAGFIHVLFGLESGANEVIKGMKKGITKEHVRYGMRLFKETDMKATAFLIAGLPGETDETIDETIEFVQEIQNINYLYYDDIGVSMIYPGTDMYTMAKATGKIDDSYWLTDKGVPYYTDENGGVHTYEKLLEMKERIRQGVSLNRMFSVEGFLKQKKLIPKILEYSQLHNVHGINNILANAINHFQLSGELIRSLFLGGIKDVRAKLAVATEKIMVASIIEQNKMQPTQKKEFILQCQKQTEFDKETLREYKKRQEENYAKFIDKEDKGDVEYISPVDKKKNPIFNIRADS